MKQTEKTFKDRFLKLLEKNGVTPKRFSQETGISLYVTKRWVKGESAPKCSHLIILSDYFGVDTDFLCGFKDENGNKLYPPQA